MCDYQRGIKTAIFSESDPRNQLVTLKFHQLLISIFLSPSIHDIQPNLEIMTSQNKEIFQNFEKLTKEFDLLKMRMGGSVETSIVVWSRYNTLKPFPKTLENEVIKGFCFTPFAKYYTNFFLILVF